MSAFGRREKYCVFQDVAVKSCPGLQFICTHISYDIGDEGLQTDQQMWDKTDRSVC